MGKFVKLGAFGWRILLLAAVTTIVVVLILNFQFIRTLTETLENSNEDIVRVIADYTASEIELSLNTASLDHLRRILDRLKTEEMMEVVFIFDTDGNIVASAPEDIDAPEGISPASEFPKEGIRVGDILFVSRNLGEGENLLGSVMVGIDMGVVSAVRDGLVKKSVFTAFVLLVVAMIVFFAVILRDVSRLRGTFGRVENVASELVSTSSDVLSSGQELEATSKSQSEKISDSTAAIAEMTTSIGEVAATAKQAQESATTGRDVAVNGAQIIKDAATGMDRIQNTIRDTGEKVTLLGESGKKIGKIVDVITQIAEQTSLLALNAAIEAARAGEHGRGFAVVADEVSKLAERVSRSAKEIEGIINSIQQETANAVETTEKAAVEVDAQVTAAHHATEALDNIQSTISSIADMINAITTAMYEQERAAEEIQLATEAINSSGREGVAAAESLVASGNQLKQQANVLDEAIETAGRLIGS